jgi:hypothetical protein
VYYLFICLQLLIYEFRKKNHATDKLLENISAKKDSFTVAMQNQLSFNKMLEK